MGEVEVEVEFFMKKPVKGLKVAPPKAESRKSSLDEIPLNNQQSSDSNDDNSSRRSSSDHVYLPLPPRKVAAAPPSPPSPPPPLKYQKAEEDETAALSDIDERKLMELQEAFLLFDLNQDGIIDKQDLLLTFQTLGQNDISENEVLKMLSEAPNPLNFDNFVQLLGYKTIELDDEDTLVHALSQWDYDNSGLISEEQIRHDLMTWGDKFSQKEVDVALEDAPVYTHEGKAMIDYIKFCKALCGLRKKP